MTASYKDLLNHKDLLAFNPVYTQQAMLDVLEAALDGEMDIVDPTNPFMFLLEASATAQANVMAHAEALSRRQYRKLATSFEDLYPHMSDRDYVGRFSKPSELNGGLTLLYDYNDIMDSAVLDGTSGNKRLIIPKDTQWTVDDMSFYGHYPINIDILANGDVITYLDLSVNTPLDQRNSNLLTSYRTIVEGNEYLSITVPVEQLRIESYTVPVTTGTGWSGDFPFVDMFYYCRAFYTTDNITWTEMFVTHDEQVHDAATPTMILRVEDSNLFAKIPDIYITSGSVGNNIRLDILTTKGPITKSLGDYSPDEWDTEYNNFDNLSTTFVDPIRTINSRAVFSTGELQGGSAGKSLDELKEIVNYNLYGKPVPVSDKELEVHLGELGYGLARQKNTVMDRLFTATRLLDADNSISTTHGIGVSNGTLTIDPTRSDIPSIMSVANGRTIIRSGALIKTASSGLQIMSDTDAAAMRALSDSDVADVINNGEYTYNPFHYVMDDSNNVYSARAYYMDKPSVGDQSYVSNNATVGYVINTNNVNITRDGDNFNIVVTANHPNGLTDAVLQLSYLDGIGAKRYLDAAQVPVTGTTSTFSFVVETSMDIDNLHNIEVLNAMDSAGVVSPSYMPLNGRFDLFYLGDTGVISPSPFDSEINRSNYTTATGVVREQATFKFAEVLDGLFVKSRLVMGPVEYERYSSDVLKYYTTDVYKMDANGRVYTKDEVTGEITFAKVHSAGDPVLDDEGNHEVLYYAGSLKTDPVTGFPIPVSTVAHQYELRMVLLDGAYAFATESSSIAYKDSIPTTIIDYINNDIMPFRDSLIERTELFFEPRSTKRSSPVKLDGESVRSINTSLSFELTYLLDKVTARDAELREAITVTTKRIIKEMLSETVVSMSELIDRLNSAAGSEVVNVDVVSPFGISTVAELQDNDSHFAVKSMLQPLSNGKLGIVDDMSITFKYVQR